jgi:hypothetical protein
MNHKQLYEIKDVDADGSPEVVMSRYNDGNDNLENPDFVVTVSSSKKDGVYDTTTAPDDVDGDGYSNDVDESYYTVAAKLVSELVKLSSVNDPERFDRTLLMFKDSNSKDVSILHFKVGNTNFYKPDVRVIATEPNTLGSYRAANYSIDTDDVQDKDPPIKKNMSMDEKLAYRNIASSFASMRDLKPKSS